jgi:peptidoglycan/LPS O-acetylase OafA/YrhL
MRATAVLTVYFAHVLQMFGIDSVGGIQLTSVSQTGVLTFFVHTSLVLMLSMERMTLPSRSPAVTFYVRRFFRIYPLSVFTVLFVVLLRIPPFPTRPYEWLGWPGLLSNLALTQNLTFSPSAIGPLWSLPLEVQMYLFLPFLFLLVKRTKGAPIAFALWGLAVTLAPLQERFLARLSLLQYAPCFLPGIIAFTLLRYATLKLPSWGWLLAILFAYAIRVFGFRAGWVACLLLGIAAPQFRDFTWRPLCVAAERISRYSYGIYLSHVIIFWFSFVYLHSYPLVLRIISCALLSVVCPVVLYHCLEKPMITLGIRLSNLPAVLAERRSGAAPGPSLLHSRSGRAAL